MITTSSIRTTTKKALFLFSLAAIVITTKKYNVVNAELSCSSTEECEKRLRSGSKCVDGFCSNPFAEGCLKTMLAEEEIENLSTAVLGALNGRVCNSDDAKNGDGNDNAFCLANEFEYPEIRIFNANWESSIFISWIMQIMLMEILKVPVSIGLNSNLTNISGFYAPRNTLQYASKGYPWDALRNAVDCETTNEDCVQVLPEVWNGQVSKWISYMQEGIIEPADGCGQVGKLGWFVPSSTANRDVTLVSFYGLRGEENREKLAKAFKRPTSWYEYCEEVSDDNCTTPDAVAEHYPPSDSQALKYFEERQYTGYFRMLPQNNCTEFPDTCTGYMVSPLCTWSTNVDAQIYWNDVVGLATDGPNSPNGGYEYNSQIEIWKAANATKSDVMMWWWQPEALVEAFSSSDWSFQQIVLPTVTDVCYRARIGVEDRCSEDIAVRRGDALGACDQEAHALQKIISSTLQKQTMLQSETSRSPAYPFIRFLKITDIDIQTLLKMWMVIGVDQYGNDAREAVCSWVIEHMDTLLDFVPPGHPKTLDPTSSYQQEYLYAAMAMAICCALGILVTAGFVYRWRSTKVFVYAQVTFVHIILSGFLLVCIGGFIFSLEPTAFTCVARIWCTNLGYSIELAAVLIKISTINRIMQSSKKLRRVVISRNAMFGSIGFLVMLELVFLISWTLVSPPQAVENRVLPDEFSTTVEVSLTCLSKQVIWPYLSVVWQTLLLLVASVLAFQSRDIVPDFNESRSIGTMIYSHFLFMILRLIVFYLGLKELIPPNVFGACLSFLFCFDILFATIIYIIPKCIEAQKAPDIYNSRAFVRSSFNTRNSYQYSAKDLKVEKKESGLLFNLRGNQSHRHPSFELSSHRASSSELLTTKSRTGGGNSEDFIVKQRSKSRVDSDEEYVMDGTQPILSSITEFDLVKLSIMSSGESSKSSGLSSHEANTVNDNDGVMPEIPPPPPPTHILSGINNTIEQEPLQGVKSSTLCSNT